MYVVGEGKMRNGSAFPAPENLKTERSEKGYLH